MGANEKHAATYHGGEYTPTTAIVHSIYMTAWNSTVDPVDQQEVQDKARDEFTRWLETVRAEAKAEALHEVLTVISAEIEDAPPANYEEDNYEAGYIAGLDFLLNAKALDNQHKENQS